jgi:hypothetical protein
MTKIYLQILKHSKKYYKDLKIVFERVYTDILSFDTSRGVNLQFINKLFGKSTYKKIMCYLKLFLKIYKMLFEPFFKISCCTILLYDPEFDNNANSSSLTIYNTHEGYWFVCGLPTRQSLALGYNALMQ